jgi:Na+/glutamate symporter
LIIGLLSGAPLTLCIIKYRKSKQETEPSKASKYHETTNKDETTNNAKDNQETNLQVK